MRENVSLIFAVLIAVFILIVLPLLSIMSRQDSIAYNQVLTYTTKFVDDVRLKGYLTEEDYTRYLADIASTGNTYKVEMECRKKIYIPDSADTYVEDTLIYYNKYINSELDVENGGKGIIELKSNDEFYVKVYNTNITTASLLYNYFLRSNIPRKIVNIGYGGMVYSKSGKEFTETSFASTYAPEIKLAENETVKNTMGENCANTFYEDVGDKKIENTYYLFDLRQQKNQTLQVKFLLQNFEKIGNIEKGDNNWDNNSEGIKEAIKNNVALTGEVKANYNKEVKDIVIKDNGDITCTVKISNISLQEGVERTTSKIVIKEGLGEGSTGIVSVAGNSNEFILLYEKYDPAINITGPLKTESAISTTLSYEWDNKKAVVYFKVRGITGIDRKLENISNFKYTIIDVNNGQEVVSLQGTGTSQTKQGISIKVTTKEENNETVAYVQVNLEKVQDVNTYKLKVEGTYTENRGMGNEKTNNLTPKESYPFTVKDKEEYDPNITISRPYKSKNKESQTEFEYTETKSETVYFYVETTDIDTSTLKYMVVKGETQETNVVITTDGKWITIVAKEGVATDTNLKLRVSGTEKNKVEGQTSKRTITAESSTFKYVVPATFKLQGPYTNANFSTKQTNWTYSDTSDTITMYFKLNIENINININATSMVISNGTKEFTNENSFTADLDKKSGYYLITVTITSPYSLEGTNKLGITVNGTPIQSEEFIIKLQKLTYRVKTEAKYSGVNLTRYDFSILTSNDTPLPFNTLKSMIKDGKVQIVTYDTEEEISKKAYSISVVTVKKVPVFSLNINYSFPNEKAKFRVEIDGVYYYQDIDLKGCRHFVAADSNIQMLTDVLPLYPEFYVGVNLANSSSSVSSDLSVSIKQSGNDITDKFNITNVTNSISTSVKVLGVQYFKIKANNTSWWKSDFDGSGDLVLYIGDSSSSIYIRKFGNDILQLSQLLDENGRYNAGYSIFRDYQSNIDYKEWYTVIALNTNNLTNYINVINNYDTTGDNRGFILSKHLRYYLPCSTFIEYKSGYSTPNISVVYNIYELTSSENGININSNGKIYNTPIKYSEFTLNGIALLSSNQSIDLKYIKDGRWATSSITLNYDAQKVYDTRNY